MTPEDFLLNGDYDDCDRYPTECINDGKSFDRDVVITNPEKIREIKTAMASGKRAFSEIKPSSKVNAKDKELLKRCFCQMEED